MHRIVFTLIFFQQIFLFAQEKSDKVNSEKVLDKTFIEFKWSNDFTYETDYYYSNGFYFEVIGPWVKQIPINAILVPSSKESINQFGVSLVQDIYTPHERFDVEKQIDGDRPFAAYMLLGLRKKTYDPTREIKIISELQIGVLGPAALGEEVQNGIHDMLPTSSRINGWENQISNSLAINYSAEIYKSFYTLNWLELLGVAKGKLGIPFTHVELGGILRLGYFDSYPNGFDMFSKNKWSAYFFTELLGKAVGYNATLQGGLFSSSFYTLDKINHLLANYRLGITAHYNLLKLEMATTFNTPEFLGALSHRWSYISIQVGF